MFAPSWTPRGASHTLYAVPEENARSMDMHGDIAEEKPPYKVNDFYAEQHGRGRFTPLGSELIQDITRQHLPGIELCVLLIVLDELWSAVPTPGFAKKQVNVPDIAQRADLPVHSVRRAMTDLKDRKIITVIQENSPAVGNHGDIITINTDPLAWLSADDVEAEKCVHKKLYSQKSANTDAQKTAKTGSQKTAKTGSQKTAKTGSQKSANLLKSLKREHEEEFKEEGEQDALRATAPAHEPEPASPFQPYQKETQLEHAPPCDISPVPKQPKKSKADDTPIESLFRTLFAARYPGKTWGGSQTDRDALAQLVHDKGEDVTRAALVWWMTPGRGDRAPSTPKWAINPTSVKYIYAHLDMPATNGRSNAPPQRLTRLDPMDAYKKKRVPPTRAWEVSP